MAIDFGQFAVAIEFVDFIVVTRQSTDHGFTGLAQALNHLAHVFAIDPRGANRRFERARLHHGHQLLDIQAKAHRRTAATKRGTHLVVAATAHQGIGHALRVNGKTHAAVVRIAAQIGQIEGNRGTAYAARQLAQACGAAVVTFDYRLAPEHRYPAGLEDCAAVWAGREAILPGRRWSVAGDSAGANLAMALMLRLAGRDLPQAGLMFYGVWDADFESPSYQAIADGLGLTRDKMRRFWDFYADAGARAHDPCLTPANAPDALLADLPPLYLNAAEIDPLCSDSQRLAARLHALGRGDVFDLVPGVTHGFMQMSMWLPQSVAAFRRAGDIFREMT